MKYLFLAAVIFCIACWLGRPVDKMDTTSTDPWRVRKTPEIQKTVLLKNYQGKTGSLISRSPDFADAIAAFSHFGDAMVGFGKSASAASHAFAVGESASAVADGAVVYHKGHRYTYSKNGNNFDCLFLKNIDEKGIRNRHHPSCPMDSRDDGMEGR